LLQFGLYGPNGSTRTVWAEPKLPHQQKKNSQRPYSKQTNITIKYKYFEL